MDKKQFINTGQIMTASDYIKSYESSLSLTNTQIVCVYKFKNADEPDRLFVANTTPSGMWSATVGDKRVRAKKLEKVEDKIWNFIEQSLHN